MIATLPQIIAAVRTTLQDLVLPDLQANSWTAGGVRSSLALLTYVEDTLAHGPDALRDGNAAIGTYFATLLESPDITFIDEEVRARLRSALREQPEPHAAGLDHLEQRQRVLKQLLSDLIAQSMQRGRTASDDDQRAIFGLRQCLRELSAAENRLAQRAGAMPPF